MFNPWLIAGLCAVIAAGSGSLSLGFLILYRTTALSLEREQKRADVAEKALAAERYEHTWDLHRELRVGLTPAEAERVSGVNQHVGASPTSSRPTTQVGTPSIKETARRLEAESYVKFGKMMAAAEAEGTSPTRKKILDDLDKVNGNNASTY